MSREERREERPVLVPKKLAKLWWETARQPRRRNKPPESSKAGASRLRNVRSGENPMEARAEDIMTRDPLTCLPETKIRDAARRMIAGDCGGLVVIDNMARKIPQGFVTDRDLACRAVAEEKDPSTRVAECMTGPALCVLTDTKLSECADIMREAQIRRLVVVNERNECRGVIALCDLVKNIPGEETAALINDICEPIDGPFREDSRGYSASAERQKTIFLGPKIQPPTDF